MDRGCNTIRHSAVGRYQSIPGTCAMTCCRWLILAQAPEPHAVNQFFWEFYHYSTQFPDKWVVVHCTHGFNRTGKFSGLRSSSLVLSSACTDHRTDSSNEHSRSYMLAFPTLAVSPCDGQSACVSNFKAQHQQVVLKLLCYLQGT